ncbi:MAG: ABC transporter permease [Propionibacteriaceae bacterium]|jgi:ABC-2 type transport system permease protein|nr:ABC transporter permease [Propionibacteriaceae bacterium]
MERLAAEPLRDTNLPLGFISGTARSLGVIWSRRELVLLLVKREIKSRYKDSVLGLVWSMVRPLVMLLIYYLVIGQFLGAVRMIPSFAVYVFTGLTVWTLFNEIILMGTRSILDNAGIIKKINLPREIFPLATVGSAGFNFVIQLVILVAAALIVGGGVNPAQLHYSLLGVLVAIIWGTALALVLSAANVYLRDVQHLVEVLLLIGFWVSPVVYSWPMVASQVGSTLQEIYMANPITVAVFGMQQGLWSGGDATFFPDHLLARLLIAFGLGLVALFLCQRVFDLLQRNFAQEI